MKLFKLSKIQVLLTSRFFAILFGSVIISGTILSQEKVAGLVKDSSTGNPIPGANVVVKNSTNGTITDINGSFNLQVPTLNATLVISYLGYTTEEVPLKGRNKIEVQFSQDIMVLEETVVVGYGTHRKSHLMSRIAGVRSTYDASHAHPTTFYNPSIETYSMINETGFKHSLSNPLSTFSIDVNRAAYSNVRRFINNGQMPPADAVRIEEMLNYFTYEYPQPEGKHPFSVNAEYSDCPWEPEHKLLHIGLQGKNIPIEELPPSNLVFLIDVSGSMYSQNRLPLVKAGFKLLVNNLRDIDNVAIVVYAGAAGCVLPSTPGNQKQKIIDAIDQLEAGGSTAGGAGIKLAYEIAVNNFIRNGNNRVILATDGDFNVGVSNENDLERLIEEKRKTGVYLTCLGFGMGNYKDSKMEILANKGNGNYAYIDNLQEAQKVFIKEFGGTLFTIAKDVKLQIDFNPAKVQAYRLIGYENRRLNDEDFKDDTKDAGEMGAGHTVTAIYEIIPVGVQSKLITQPDPSKYQIQKLPKSAQGDYEVATIRLRYKEPHGEEGIEFNQPVEDNNLPFNKTSENYKFSTSIAMFGMLLRNSTFKGNSSWDQVIDMAQEARGSDLDGYRAEYIRLVKSVKGLEGTSMR